QQERLPADLRYTVFPESLFSAALPDARPLGVTPEKPRIVSQHSLVARLEFFRTPPLQLTRSFSHRGARPSSRSVTNSFPSFLARRSARSPSSVILKRCCGS